MSGSSITRIADERDAAPSSVARQPEQAAQPRQVGVGAEAWSMTLEAPGRDEIADH